MCADPEGPTIELQALPGRNCVNRPHHWLQLCPLAPHSGAAIELQAWFDPGSCDVCRSWLWHAFSDSIGERLAETHLPDRRLGACPQGSGVRCLCKGIGLQRDAVARCALEIGLQLPVLLDHRFRPIIEIGRKALCPIWWNCKWSRGLLSLPEWT